MKTKSTLLQKSLLVLGIFSVTTFVTYGASSTSEGLLKSTPYQTRSATADTQLSTMTNGSGAAILDKVIADVKTRAETKGGTPLNVSSYNAYIDGRLALLDELDNQVRLENGTDDYSFLFKYLYPRVYELKQPVSQTTSLLERIGTAMGLGATTATTTANTNTNTGTVAVSVQAQSQSIASVQTQSVAPVQTQSTSTQVQTASAPTSCTGNLPTGAGVKSTGYQVNSFGGGSVNGTVWTNQNDTQNFGCTWTCDTGFKRNGNNGCTALGAGEGITVRVLDSVTQQPLSGVSVDLYGSLSLAGGSSFGTYTTNTTGNTPEFFWSPNYYGYNMILILKKSGYTVKSGTACAVNANTPNNCWLPYNYAGTDHNITIYMSNGSVAAASQATQTNGASATDALKNKIQAELTVLAGNQAALDVFLSTTQYTAEQLALTGYTAADWASAIAAAKKKTTAITQTSAVTCADPVAYYYANNLDVKAAGVDAKTHWDTYGYKETNRPSCWPAPITCADPVAYYYANNLDVKAAGVDAKTHWEKDGRKEGRKSCWQ